MSLTDTVPSPPTDARLFDRARALVSQQLTLAGQPRSFTLAADGRRWCYLAARAHDDARLGLWHMGDDLAPHLLVDPADLGDEDVVPDAERARRERTRERAAGLTAYAATPTLDLVAFAHGGRLHVVTTGDGVRRVIPTSAPAVDPRPSPTAGHVAWVADGALWIADMATGTPRCLVADDAPDVTWGLAEFIAAEEMGRLRGFWWSPDGSTVVASRVDTSPVTRWWLHEPATPEAPPRSLRYPEAGGANADVALALLGLDGHRREVDWDTGRWPYLADVRWDDGGPLTVTVQSRDQREVAILRVDDDAATHALRTVTGDPWVELVPGVPRWAADGRLVTVEDDPATDTRRVHLDGEAHSPAGLHIDAVLAADRDGIVVSASADDPTTTALWRVRHDSAQPLTPPDGVHTGAVAGGTLVVTRSALDDPSGTTTARRDGHTVGTIARTPVSPPLPADPRLVALGERELRAALLLPSWYQSGPLPVLLDPYGGPHARRVRRSAQAFQTGQWFAEAGYAVLIVDGRGTPGRGLAWEHAVHGDLATAPLTDQVDGLLAAADRWPLLDLDRVAIRGWSFGGYLAALAVLRRPDVFHAAIAGAPVTEWRLYDTHYTERYLGDPAVDRDAYDASSLLGDAAELRRPLLLLHGLADDNVVAAHTLRLSQALLAAGRPHRVLPLTTTTHVTRDPDQQAGLLQVQLRFLRDALRESPALRSTQ